MNGCRSSDRTQEYVSKKQHPMNKKYGHWGVGQMVRMMVWVFTSKGKC